MDTLKTISSRTIGLSRMVIIAIGIAGLAGAACLAQDKPLKRTDLVQDVVGASEGTAVVSYIVDAAPGAEVGKHRHPGDEFLYILDGAVTVMPDGSSPVTVSQGEMLHLKYGVPHSARNASATEPARALVFQVVEDGKPVNEPVQ